MGKTLTAWEWRHGSGDKPRVGKSLLDGGTMQLIEGGEIKDLA